MGDNGKRAKFTQTIRVRVTPEMYATLCVLSAKKEISVGKVVRNCITIYLESLMIRKLKNKLE